MSASDFVTYYRPSRCELRVYLRHHGQREDLPSPYEEVLFRLAERHERTHMESLAPVSDLSGVPPERRVELTMRELEANARVIYQGMFCSTVNLGGTECEVIGIPDFLIRESDGYTIRDSKISRRITEQDHPEILRQLEIYGWLFEESTGSIPRRLEIHSGTGDIVDVQFDGGVTALSTLGHILRHKTQVEQPYSPVGWSKCSVCCFASHCLSSAKERMEVALVDGVDQGLALVLRDLGIETVEDLLSRLDEATLSDLHRPWGKGLQRVGKKASSILTMARAMASHQEIMLQPPELPEYPNYAMFDLEGLPPHLDELDKIYLWGLKVFGHKPTDSMAVTADFGSEGDLKGWEDFLGIAESILDAYGDIPFVHWHHYERVRLDTYMQRYGDPKGIGARLRANLLDLHPIVRKSLALPLPSYSLKVVEKYIGFQRKLEEYGGEWAMAQYVEATETKDEKLRADIMEKLLAYNREDLEATWAVLEWVRSKTH